MYKKRRPPFSKPKPRDKTDASVDRVQSAAKSATLQAGEPLEYRVARLFMYMGFFVRRGRELYTVQALDKATDLDVLAIRYTEPFRREVQIAECKSGGNGPLDRIFWLSGVRQHVGASQATLIRRSTKWNIKDFAKEVGVEILDLPRLDDLEQAFDITSDFWPGISDRSFFAARQDEWNRLLRGDPATADLYLTLAGEVRFHDPFGAINFLLHHTRTLTRVIGDKPVDGKTFSGFLLCESIAQLAMFLMRVAESTFGLSAEDRAGFIRKGLTYGHMDARLTERIFRNAYRLTTETVKHYTGKDVEVERSFFSMPSPPYVPEIQRIVELLSSSPAAATTFAPLADVLTLEIYLKQRKALDWLWKMFPRSDLPQRLQIVHSYLQTLHQIEALPETLVKSIAATIGSRLPQPQGSPSTVREKATLSSDSPSTPSEIKTFPLFNSDAKDSGDT